MEVLFKELLENMLATLAAVSMALFLFLSNYPPNGN